ncbi:MAG: ExeA family protein [Planctomycetaceae bacterium]
MYERYWQLDFNPFENDADPRGFFRSEPHQAALLKLRYLIDNRKGAGLLAADTGLGKSYLLRTLARQLDDACGPWVHLVFPQMSAGELLAYLAADLGGAREAVAGGLDRTVREIERLLALHCESDHHPVIVIDEAHLIDDPRVFEALRLLLNFQRNQHHQFSLILAGQRELLSAVRRLLPLDERLCVKCVLRAFSPTETRDYVAHRLEIAGAQRPIFAEPALRAVHELAAGVPRRINRLCDLALLVGFADESATISAEQVESVAQELTLSAAA